MRRTECLTKRMISVIEKNHKSTAVKLNEDWKWMHAHHVSCGGFQYKFDTRLKNIGYLDIPLRLKPATSILATNAKYQRSCYFWSSGFDNFTLNCFRFSCRSTEITYFFLVFSLVEANRTIPDHFSRKQKKSSIVDVSEIQVCVVKYASILMRLFYKCGSSLVYVFTQSLYYSQ